MKLFYPILFLIIVTNFDFSSIATKIGLVLLAIMFSLFYLYFKSAISVFKFIKKDQIIPFLVLVMMFIVGIFRTNLPKSTVPLDILRTLNFVLFLTLTFLLYNELVLKKRSIDFDQFFFRIISIPALFVVVSIILTLGGFDFLNNNSQGIKYGASVMAEKFLRLHVQRIGTPLGVGTNNYGLFCGGILSMSLIGFWTFKSAKYKIPMIIISVLCFVEVIIADTRSAIIWPILSVLVIFFLDYIKRLSFLKYLLIPISIVFPVVILSGSGFLKSLSISSISRSSNDIESGDGREAIWKPCWKEMEEFKFIHLIGYGEYGEIGCGASAEINLVFRTAGKRTSKDELFSTHNLFFQLFLNYGYIGLCVFFYYLFNITSKIIKIYSYTKNRNFLMFLSFILFTIFGGMTESNITHQLTFNFFWLVTIGVIALNCYFDRYFNKQIEKTHL